MLENSCRRTAGRRSLPPDQPQSAILEQDIAEVAYRTGEVITYERRGRTWIAVSGYAGEQIFYRKSHLACDGRRWHHIEFRYPIQDKVRMDATVASIARRMMYNDACSTVGRAP